MTFNYFLSYTNKNKKIYKQSFSNYYMKKSVALISSIVVTIQDKNIFKDLKSKDGEILNE